MADSYPKITGIRFPDPPPLGTSFTMSGGQVYELVEVRSNFAPLVWRTRCPASGELFEFATGLSVSAIPRRAPGHRKPGLPVVAKGGAAA